MDARLSGDRSVSTMPSNGRPLPDDGRRLVLFDLDRTLITGSSLTTLAIVAAREGLISPTSVARVVRSNVVFAVAGERGNIADVARRGVLQAIAGRPVGEFAAVAELTITRLLGRIRPEMRRAVDLHLGLGDRCIIVSASPHQIVDGVALALGMEGGVGTAGEIANEVFTGEVAGSFCHGVGKIERLREMLGTIDLGSAVCYADSMSDLPLLEAVQVPIVVSPDRSLRRLAIDRRWSIHE